MLGGEGRLSAARPAGSASGCYPRSPARHSAGLLRRDIEASNVVITTNRTEEGWEERAVLTDLGIAQFGGDP